MCRLLAGDTAEAQALSSQAMAELESHPGGEELAAIYYNHWQVMQACGQPGAAQAALEKAYAMLQAQAQSLPSPAEQQAFLHNIAVNRASGRHAAGRLFPSSVPADHRRPPDRH